MAKLLKDRHGHNWLSLRRHGNGKRALVRVQAITAIVEGVTGQDEHKAVIHLGDVHPIRVTDTFDDIAGEIIASEAVGP